MKHFISIVIDNDGINESRDFVLDTVLNTANIGLLENTMEYEIYESENNTQVLSIPIARELNEKQQAYLAKKLANKLFDKGYNNFDIEFSINEAALNEAAPTTFTPTHYGGPGGLNNVMLHTDGNLYFQKQRDDGQPGREIVRWNGNPTGEGFFGRWNPATIKGTIVNGQRVPYPAGTNFNNAPRAAAPAAAAPASRVSNTTPTGGLLRRGNRGEEVKQLQRDLGMTGDEIDGIFGPATERAVRTFQQNSGAKVDGLVGPETRAMIQKYQAPEDNSAPAQTPPAATDDAAAVEPEADAVEPEADAVEPIDGGIAPGTTAGGPSQLRQRQVPGSATDDGGLGQRPAPGASQADEVPDTAADEVPDTAADEIVVTTDNQANSIFLNPDSTEAERQAARRYYGATDEPVRQYSDIGTAMISRAEVQPGDQVVIDGEEATVVTNDNEEKYYVDPNGQPIGELPQPDVQTTVTSPGGDTSGGDSGVNNNATTDPEVNQTPPSALAQPDADDDTPSITDEPANRDAAEVLRQQEQWREKYGDRTTGRDGLPNQYVQVVDAALDEISTETAQKLADESVGAPPAIARTVLRNLNTTFGNSDNDSNVVDDLLQMAQEVEQEDQDQAAALTTLSDLAKTLDRIANPDQNNESVEPMPKGAFMVEDRAIWRSLYESTHYTNGKPRPRTFITESKMQEVTFDDDDKFFENYGVMWFNEDEMIDEAEYQGRTVKLGKPMAGDVKKFKVYVKNPKGNVVKVNFGQKGARIKKGNPERRRSFRARHNCDNPGPRHKARYWSCRKW